MCCELLAGRRETGGDRGCEQGTGACGEPGSARGLGESGLRGALG